MSIILVNKISKNIRKWRPNLIFFASGVELAPRFPTEGLYNT